MTDEQIAKLYDQALVIESNGDYVAGELDPVKFAKLVAQHERDECADLLEHGYIDDEGHHLQYAKEIRARGQE